MYVYQHHDVDRSNVAAPHRAPASNVLSSEILKVSRRIYASLDPR